MGMSHEGVFKSREPTKDVFYDCLLKEYPKNIRSSDKRDAEKRWQEKTINRKTCDSCLKECKRMKKRPKRYMTSCQDWSTSTVRDSRIDCWVNRILDVTQEDKRGISVKGIWVTKSMTESNEEQLPQDIHHHHTENPRLQEQKCSFWQVWPHVSTNPLNVKWWCRWWSAWVTYTHKAANMQSLWVHVVAVFSKRWKAVLTRERMKVGIKVVSSSKGLDHHLGSLFRKYCLPSSEDSQSCWIKREFFRLKHFLTPLVGCLSVLFVSIDR